MGRRAPATAATSAAASRRTFPGRPASGGGRPLGLDPARRGGSRRSAPARRRFDRGPCLPNRTRTRCSFGTVIRRCRGGHEVLHRLRSTSDVRMLRMRTSSRRGDGLCVFPGRTADRDLLAAPWVPMLHRATTPAGSRRGSGGERLTAREASPLLGTATRRSSWERCARAWRATVHWRALCGGGTGNRQ